MSSAAVTPAGNDATAKTHQISIPLPRSLDTRLYIHLTVRLKSILLMVTTASADEATTPTPLGSFVYAIPNRLNPSQPLCTSLLTVEPTFEFATRLARLVAKRSGLPTYVGNSVSLMSVGMGGTADEEMEAFRAVVDAVVASLALPKVNGVVDGKS